MKKEVNPFVVSKIICEIYYMLKYIHNPTKMFNLNSLACMTAYGVYKNKDTELEWNSFIKNVNESNESIRTTIYNKLITDKNIHPNRVNEALPEEELHKFQNWLKEQHT